MLALLDFIPKWVFAALVVALSATSCKLKWDNGNLHIEIEKGKTYAAQLQTAISTANAAAEKQAAENEQAIRIAEEKSKKRELAVAHDIAAANHELDGLRLALSRHTSTPGDATKGEPSDAPVDNPDPTADLLLQCGERYIDLAAKADGHVNDIKTLTEAWPK